MPDIVWVVEIEREEGLDGVDPSQTSLANQSSYFVPLGMVSNHKCFGDKRPLRSRPEQFRLGGGQRNRLFAQHMFARSHCHNRHRHMEVIGQRVVDGLDIGVV